MPDDYAASAEFYDLTPLYGTRRDVPFYVQVARSCRGPVLELGCGTGRVLIPVARAGVQVLGLDSSEAMLNVCRRKLDAEPLDAKQRARLIHGDMRDFKLGGFFKLITTPFRSFQHLTTVEEQKACLGCVRNHLSPEGSFILDVFAPNFERLAEQRVGEVTDDADFTDPATGDRVVRSWQLVAIRRDRQINVIEFAYRRIKRDGTERRTTHTFPMRYFFRYELEHLLGLCGFEVSEVYGDYDCSPFAGDREIIVVSRRK